MLTRNTLRHEQLRFVPQCINQEKLGFCRYSIHLLGNSPDSEQSSFRLLVRQATSFVEISQNQPVHGVLHPDKKHYYHFYLGGIDRLRSVNFRVSASHLNIFVSTNCQHPDDHCPNTKHGSYDSPVRYSAKELEAGAQFFITVEALTKIVKYSIIADIRRNDEINVHSLWEGMPFSYDLAPGEDLALFRFYVHLKEKKSIDIHLDSPKGQIFLLVSNGDTNIIRNIKDSKTGNEFLNTIGQWKTSREAIHISHNDQAFRRKGHYYVLVARSDMAEIESSVFFTLTYATDNTVRHLPSNNHVFGKLTADSSHKRYFFYVHPKDTVQVSVFLLGTVLNNQGTPLTASLSNSPIHDEGNKTSSFELAPATIHSDKDFFLDLDKGKNL
jgi:hypothetical protein